MDFPLLPRRQFLKAAVATGMLLSAAVPVRAAPAGPRRHATGAGTLLVLDDRRASILAAFADAAIATGDGFPTIAETGLVARIDEELFFTDAAIRDDFLLAIDAIDLLPFAYGHLSHLRRLPLAGRRDFLERRAGTRIATVRAMVNGLRLVTGLVYYANRAAWAAMAYDGTHAGLPPLDSEQRAFYRESTGYRANTTP